LRTLSTYETALAEKASAFFGADTGRLMENAGRGLAEAVIRDYRPAKKKIIIVCGTGNNAGDGLVALRVFLTKGYKAKAVLAGGKPHGEALSAYRKVVKKFPHSAEGTSGEIGKAGIIIDAIFGTGFRGAVSGIYAGHIRKMNRSAGIRVSVDVPSGLDAENGKGTVYVKANRVYAMHAMKKGLAGMKRITRVIDIGIPETAQDILKRKGMKCRMKRAGTSRKGQNGVIALIAGSEQYPGAAALAASAAKAAFRAGSDLVTVACPEKVAWLVNIKIPDAISIKLRGGYIADGHKAELLKLAQKSDCILIGPGIGLKKETVRAVREMAGVVEKKVVIDADGIKAVSGMKFRGNTLLTPHSHEFELCFGVKLPEDYKRRAETVRKAAKKHKCTILLKGPLDIISDGKKTVFNATGNAGMASGGTGDVLAGLCCAFAAKKSLFDAACCAAYINGYCGDMLFKEKSYGLMASDLTGKIPEAMKELCWW
jgi:NAD(P)H-hydrate epimerase